MRYKKEILIAGAFAIRRKEVESLQSEQRQSFEEEENILKQYTDDQPKIEEISRRIVRMAEDGEEISSAFLAQAFKVETAVPSSERYLTNGIRTLGLDRDRLAKVQRQITQREKRLNSLESEPLRIVEFLQAIDDDMVSDHGLKQAGFSIRTSELVTAGLEELRNEKATEGQDAEIGQ